MGGGPGERKAREAAMEEVADGRQRCSNADGAEKEKSEREKREWRRSIGPTHVTEAKKIDRSHQKLQSNVKSSLGYKRCIF